MDTKGRGGGIADPKTGPATSLKSFKLADAACVMESSSFAGIVSRQSPAADHR
jgi:hypothetical protein